MSSFCASRFTMVPLAHEVYSIKVECKLLLRVLKKLGIVLSGNTNLRVGGSIAVPSNSGLELAVVDVNKYLFV